MTLNMEGTKHEKALLVILSYVAGFTAGFLVFGLSQTPTLQSNETYTEVAVVDPSASEMVSEEGMTEEAPVMSDTTKEVMYQDGRLMANVNGASVLLSAQLATVDPETAKAFASQGVHEAIPNYLASEDGNFIYYCEQHDFKDSCMNFIYNVSTETIHYVTLDGVKLETTAAAAQTASWNNYGLTINNNTSEAPETPWRLTTAQ